MFGSDMYVVQWHPCSSAMSMLKCIDDPQSLTKRYALFPILTASEGNSSGRETIIFPKFKYPEVTLTHVVCILAPRPAGRAPLYLKL